MTFPSASAEITATGLSARWVDAVLAAALLAVDPVGLGGVIVKAHAGPVRDRWLELLRQGFPDDAPVRKLPIHADADALLGGLDLATTLSQGKPVIARGLLANCQDGLLVAPGAERLSPMQASLIASAIDNGMVRVERDGAAKQYPAEFVLVALDEGVGPDERVPTSIVDRVAFHIDLTSVSWRGLDEFRLAHSDLISTRNLLEKVEITDQQKTGLCAAATMLGLQSLRPALFAIRAARVSAALNERDTVADEDIECSVRLVLAPRAVQIPQLPEDQQEPPPDHQEPESAENEKSNLPDGALEDRVVEAAKAALPPDLLRQLMSHAALLRNRGTTGHAGQMQRNARRGRPISVQSRPPYPGARLKIIDTLRAAAPWQPFRNRKQVVSAGKRVIVHKSDFRFTRLKNHRESVTIFTIDASGSAAMQRLAEAKGAVELLLAECYIRRDQVAVIAFRHKTAELLLPPTRSLARAKRSLAGLPGGGGTPLACGLEAAFGLADAESRRGLTPVLVILTDGRANISRDGTADRIKADEDAKTMAKLIHHAGFDAIVIDTATRPDRRAAAVAKAMNASYMPLPNADAKNLSNAVLGFNDARAR